MSSLLIAEPVSSRNAYEAPPGRINASLVCRRGSRIQGIVEEMSPIDLRMFVTRPVRLGMLVSVRLAPEGWNCEFDATGVVHRSEQLAGGADVGIFLSEPLSEELVAACWLEMRRELRYPVIWSLWGRSELHKKTLPVTVVNYSYSGVQIRLAHHARPGENIALHNDEPLTVATVRWAAASHHGEAICGCVLPKSEGLKLALRLQLRQS